MDYATTFISFTDEDLTLAASISEVAADQQYGLRRFPAPEQYHRHVDQTLEEAELPNPAAIYAVAQRDWHMRGQNGCVFARLAARAAPSLSWRYVVVFGATDGSQLHAISEHVQTMSEEPGTQVVSVLFPEVREAGEAASAIRGLACTEQFWLERDDVIDDMLRLHLRYTFGEEMAKVDAWIMAFGPFNFVPNTRRAPYFELAIRVKEKPALIFHKLNQDRDVAHLADVSLDMSDRYWEHRWRSTLNRTRMILGGEPDDISAAKSTLAIPVSLLPAEEAACR